MARRLSAKKRIFVNAIIEGKTQTQAYIDAYNTKGHLPTVYAEASRTARLPQVREAIEQALFSQNVSPEFAVCQLKRIAEQNRNYSTKRAACMDILKLWGWGSQEKTKR